jgi:hypothetical protein
MTIKTLKARLTRGVFVQVADTFTNLGLRGKQMLVASKGTVKCNKAGRCAGDWCKGLAVFVTDPEPTTPEEGEDPSPMGWRRNTVKICLTHLLDDQGVPLLDEPHEEVLPPLPPSDASRFRFLTPTVQSPDNGSVVTWDMLAKAAEERDFSAIVLMARRLIEVQGTLLRLLQPE